MHRGWKRPFGDKIKVNINKSLGNNSNILNNKIKLKKEEMYYIDYLSKQKNDLKKLMLKNSNKFEIVNIKCYFIFIY